MNKVFSIKNSVLTIISSIAFIVYIVIGLLLNTTINFKNWYKFAKIIQYICIIILIIITGILLVFFNYKISWLNILLFVGGVVNFLVTKHIFILFLALSFFTLKKCNIEYVLKLHCYSLVVVLLSTFILANIGIIENIISYRYENGVEVYKRYGFGFKAVTLPLSLLFFILVEHLIIKKFNFNFFDYLIYIASGLFLFAFTRTRTGFLLVLMLLTMNYLSKIKLFKKIFNSRFIKISITFLPIILTIVTFFLCWFYDQSNSFMSELNHVLTGRLYLTHNLFSKYGITLFGSVINVNDNGFYIGSDISYMFYILEYGLFNLILILFLIFSSIKKCRSINSMYIIILFFVIMNSLVEPYLMDLKYHVIFLLPFMPNFVAFFK